jgi:hypothetical protein
MKNAYNISVGKFERKRSLWRRMQVDGEYENKS